MRKDEKSVRNKFFKELYFKGESTQDPLSLMKYSWFKDLLEKKELIILEQSCKIHPTEYLSLLPDFNALGTNQSKAFSIKCL